MKNSILILSAGVILGVLSTLLLQPDSEQALSTSDNEAIKNQMNKTSDAIDSEVSNETMSQKTAHETTSLSSTSTNQNPMKAATNMNLEAGVVDFGKYQEQASNPHTNTTQQESMNIPPSEEQIAQYHSIEMRLQQASNNKSVNLSQLIMDADILTNAQRKELTSIAMNMIQNGEITTSQFAPDANRNGGY